MINTHTYIFILPKKTTSKSPVKAEFVKSGGCIKNAGFIEPQPPAKSSAVSSSHMTQIRPTVYVPTNRLVSQDAQRSRCLQSHLVAPFGNRTGLKA